MSRQRRSPSITKDGPPTPTQTTGAGVQSTDFTTRNSVRQSPSPLNDNIMPTGAVISPPESDNSDDGEGKERGRELEIAELQKAVRSIDLRREGSPDKVGQRVQLTVSAPITQITSPSALTPEARKISHSRSATAEIVNHRPTFTESPIQTTDDSEDDDEDGPHSKPSLVRKKSGELVKPALRPSSRRRYSSMPGTPTYHKSVHFNESENQTRHFLQVDKPMAVSAGTSPIETYDSETEYPFDYSGKSAREMKLANFPADTYERKLKPVRVERIFLSSDNETLVGTVAVQNLGFQKLVIARFTLDHWKTTSEVVAEYNNDLQQSSDGCDKFNFNIKLSDSANIESKTLLLCVRYNVNGVDYWDNNDDRNYQIDFVKAVKKSKNQPNSSLGARPLSAIPRSRHLPPSSPIGPGRGRSDSTDDEFGARFDMGSTYQFCTPNKIITESGGSILLKPKPKRQSTLPNGPTQSHNNLGGRYDFGASLSAALSTAQDRLGRNSGLMNGAPQKQDDGYFALQDRNDSPITMKEEKPDFSVSSGGSDRPAMGSAQYRDLVQKFCYVGSSNKSPSAGVSSAGVTTRVAPAGP
jgi:hypothetical protein